MCGIVGVAGEIGDKEKKAFRRMLELDTTRGPHSTGVFLVGKDGNVKHDKVVGTPWALFKESPLCSLAGDFYGSHKVMVGHNRWATTGAVTKENAHPFDFEKVVGVHNGTLGWQSIAYVKKNGSDHEVDSQMLYSSINNVGLSNTIKNVNGAWSLVYWDKVREELNFIRNKERPMFYSYSADRKTLFFASEEWMIRVATSLSGIKISGVMSTKEDINYFLPLIKDCKEGDTLHFRYYEHPLVGKTYVTERLIHYGDWGSGYGGDWLKREKKAKRWKDSLLESIEDSAGNVAIFFDKDKAILDRSQYTATVTFYSLVGNYEVEVRLNTRDDVESIWKELNDVDCDGWFEIECWGVRRSQNSNPILLANFSTMSDIKDWKDYKGNLSKKEDLEEDPPKLINISKGGYSVDLGTFNKAMEEPCAHCGSNGHSWKVADKIFWLNFPKKEYLCPDCASDMDNVFAIYGH